MHLGALSHCNSVFTSFFLSSYFFGGGTGRGKDGALSTSMSMQVAVGVWSSSMYELSLFLPSLLFTA